MPHRRRRFLAYWTLKEAYVKALGIGLRVPLKEIEIDFAPGGAIELSVSAKLADEKQWILRLLAAPDGYAAALAVASPVLRDLEVRQRTAIRADLLGHERI